MSAAKSQYVQESKPLSDVPANGVQDALPSTGFDVAFTLALAAILTLGGVFLRGLVRER